MACKCCRLQQRVGSEASHFVGSWFGGCRVVRGIGRLWERHEVTCCRHAISCFGTDSHCFTGERSLVGRVHQNPVGVQAASGPAVATWCRGVGSAAGNQIIGLGVHHGGRARSLAVHVLDSGEQGGASGDVGSVQDFHIAFACFSVAVGGVHAASLEQTTLCLDVSNRGQCAACVVGVKSRQIARSRNGSRPHVARRQEDRDVENVVRIGGTTEAQLDSLAVCGVRVGDVQQRSVAALCREVRDRQDVANTSHCRVQVSGRDSSCSQASAAWNSSVAQKNSSVSHAGHATNHGSNAQGEKIFSHVLTPVKVESATTKIDYAARW